MALKTNNYKPINAIENGEIHCPAFKEEEIDEFNISRQNILTG